ncbi:MAG: hypothetical protein ABSG25_11075 [Bryobacteraceae bacterium]
MKRTWMAVSILVTVSALVDCKKAEPPSTIVKKVEDAGSGELSQATTKSIYDWFNKHQELAKEIKSECLQVKDSKPANWSDTTEGRVCSAAISSTMIGNEPIRTDDKKY